MNEKPEIKETRTTCGLAVAPCSAFLCGHTTGIDCGSGQRAFNDFITFDEETAKAHVAKYKGSWSEAGWYVRLPVLPNFKDEP
jgi:hypothetical protein